MRRSSRGQRIVFRLPPYDTPRAARCNKTKFRVHRRHAAGGVCEQRITALRKYIYRWPEILAGRYFGGLLKICHLAEFTLAVEPGLAIMIFITKWLLKRARILIGP